MHIRLFSHSAGAFESFQAGAVIRKEQDFVHRNRQGYQQQYQSLQLKWASLFQMHYCKKQPAVVGDWLIVGSQFGDVYAIHQQTVKPRWKVCGKCKPFVGYCRPTEREFRYSFLGRFSVPMCMRLMLKQANSYGTTGRALKRNLQPPVLCCVWRQGVCPITSVEVSSAYNNTYE